MPIGENVTHDDGSLIDAPTQGLRIQDHAVPDAVDRPAQTISNIIDPVFASVDARVAVTVIAKWPARIRHPAFRCVEWKIKEVYGPAGCTSLRRRLNGAT